MLLADVSPNETMDCAAPLLRALVLSEAVLPVWSDHLSARSTEGILTVICDGLEFSVAGPLPQLEKHWFTGVKSKLIGTRAGFFTILALTHPSRPQRCGAFAYVPHPVHQPIVLDRLLFLC